MYLRFKKGARKNSIKVLSFAKQRGGGVFDCSEQTNEQTFMESVVRFDFEKEAGQ